MNTSTELKGSPRQVKWAKDIRSKVLAEADTIIERRTRTIERLRTRGMDVAVAREEAKMASMKKGLAELEAEASASWWIDHQGPARVMLRHKYEPGWLR